jgi:AcrR family transcriptional regulator
MRQALLTAGARQFASRGVGQVSVEDLLAEADVSRATFYAMFSSKYNLLESILNPIFDTATVAISALAKESARAGLTGILDTYLELWRTHREGLLLITAVDAATFHEGGESQSAAQWQRRVLPESHSADGDPATQGLRRAYVGRGIVCRCHDSSVDPTRLTRIHRAERAER